MRVGDADLTEWKRVFELNLYGTLNCMRAELDVMKKQGRGSIVNNLSMLANKVMQTQSHYAASKRAILAVQEHAALEHVKDGIRVNSVSPGFARPSEVSRRTAHTGAYAQISSFDDRCRRWKHS